MKNLSYEDIRKMRRGTNAFDIYNFPFLDGVKIAIRVLTQNEILECLDAWRDDAKRLFKQSRDIDAIQMGMAKVMEKAVYVPAENPWDFPTTPFFRSSKEVLELSVDETRLLEEYYNTTQEKYAPVQVLQTESDYLELIEAIKKKLIDGSYLSSLTLKELVTFLVDKYQLSPSDNGTTMLPWQYLNEKKKQKPVAEVEVVSNWTESK